MNIRVIHIDAEKNRATVLIQDDDGKFAFGVMVRRMTPSMNPYWCLYYGISEEDYFKLTSIDWQRKGITFLGIPNTVIRVNRPQAEALMQEEPTKFVGIDLPVHFATHADNKEALLNSFADFVRKIRGLLKDE